MNTFATIMAAAAMAGSANAFYGTGHLLISRGAQAILESDSSSSLDQALDILAYLKKSQASLTKDEGDHPFTECATFADNIKGQGYSAQSDWHFIDQPYLSDGGTIEDYPEFKVSPVDVVDALTDLTAFLKGDQVSMYSPYIPQIQDWFADENDQFSFALRLVIHYAGDIHQPLHSTTEVSNEFPKGDRGGNYQHTPDVDGTSNLHGDWDSVIYQYTGYPDLPLNSEDWSWYTSEAASLAKQYPVDPTTILAGEFQTWAEQGLQIAKDTVYAGFKINEALSAEYMAKAKPVLEARIAIGGARLAALIKDIYPSKTEEVAFLQ